MLPAFSPFPTMFSKDFFLTSIKSCHLDNFLPFSSHLKMSSANSFSLEESKICCLGKGLHLGIGKKMFHVRHNPRVFLTCFSAISRNFSLSSRHILAASTFAALSSFGSVTETELLTK